MFAVIKTGGKQYRVAKDDVITIEKLAGEAGEAVAFTDVLMVSGDGGPDIGAPLVEGATVTGEVVEQGRAAKIIVFKKKRRKNYRRTHGHRQHETLVRITDILTGGAKPKATKKIAAAKPNSAPAPASAKAEAKAKPEAKSKSKAPAKAEPAAKSGGANDDLKKIAGIGPVIEKKLFALGITTYAEIASFGEDDIARVNDQLNFKGRIEREEWVQQATKLAKET